MQKSSPSEASVQKDTRNAKKKCKELDSNVYKLSVRQAETLSRGSKFRSREIPKQNI